MGWLNSHQGLVRTISNMNELFPQGFDSIQEMYILRSDLTDDTEPVKNWQGSRRIVISNEKFCFDFAGGHIDYVTCIQK